MSRREPKRESWQFTNDRYHTEYGSRKAILEYMEDLPDIIYPFVGFVRQIRKDGTKQLYIATKRLRYPSKEWKPALVRYRPDL